MGMVGVQPLRARVSRALSSRGAAAAVWLWLRLLDDQIQTEKQIMTINQITVTAARTFNHPHEQYSNLRPEVVLTATLAPGEDAGAATKKLQAMAEGMVEDHKQGMLKSIEELYQLSERQAEVRGLQQQLERTQQRLSEIRAENPGLAQIGGGADSPR